VCVCVQNALFDVAAARIAEALTWVRERERERESVCVYVCVCVCACVCVKMNAKKENGKQNYATSTCTRCEKGGCVRAKTEQLASL